MHLEYYACADIELNESSINLRRKTLWNGRRFNRPPAIRRQCVFLRSSGSLLNRFNGTNNSIASQIPVRIAGSIEVF
jgi:hypothetical protein